MDEENFSIKIFIYFPDKENEKGYVNPYFNTPDGKGNDMKEREFTRESLIELVDEIEKFSKEVFGIGFSK